MGVAQVRPKVPKLVTVAMEPPVASGGRRLPIMLQGKILRQRHIMAMNCVKTNHDGGKE